MTWVPPLSDHDSVAVAPDFATMHSNGAAVAVADARSTTTTADRAEMKQSASNRTWRVYE